MKNVSVFFFSGREQSYMKKWKTSLPWKNPGKIKWDQWDQTRFFDPSLNKKTNSWALSESSIYSVTFNGHNISISSQNINTGQNDFKTFCTKERFLNMFLSEHSVSACLCVYRRSRVFSKAVFVVSCRQFGWWHHLWVGRTPAVVQ